MSVAVREATPDDRPGVRRILDAAMLEIRSDLGARIDAGDVLVARESDESPVLGALVLVPTNDGAHVNAVAVRRSRRDRGIGTRLVRTAAERRDRLTAEFDPSVRPFYESLGFDVCRIEDDERRLRGRYED